MNNDYYRESGEIEVFLKGILNPKAGSKAFGGLKGAYQSIKLYEDGYGVITPSEQQKEVERLLKYFDKAIDILIKRNPEMKSKGESLKSQLDQIATSSDIWHLYQQLRMMR